MDRCTTLRGEKLVEGRRVGEGAVDSCRQTELARDRCQSDFKMLTSSNESTMSDKPSFVKYSHSVLLDKFERFSRSGTRRISKLLAARRKKIERFSSEAQTQQRQGIHLVYFGPLNSNDNHFTLLEINERERKMHYYDSMAREDVIDGSIKPTRVGKAVQLS